MLAVVQFKPRRGARNANLEALMKLVTAALEGGAKLVVLPEMAATGYRFPNPEVVRPLAESPRGATFKTFSPLAKQYKAHIVIGYVEDFEGRLFNAAMVINPDGKLEAQYRKRYLYIDDLTWANPGDLPYVSFQTPFGSATIGICMDINDPRFVTHVRRTKPDIVCFPTNWVDESSTGNNTDIHKYWANQLRGWNGWLLAADRWGQEDDVIFWGRSAIMKGADVQASGPPEGDGWWLVQVPEKAPPAPVVPPAEKTPASE